MQHSAALGGFDLAGLAGSTSTHDFAHYESRLVDITPGVEALKVIINCPGYGGRKLWADESIVPVRGQIAWLIPQAGVHYGVIYKALNVVARRDGIVVQPMPGGDDVGWNDANEEPDRQAAEVGVLLLEELFGRMAAMRR